MGFVPAGIGTDLYPANSSNAGWTSRASSSSPKASLTEDDIVNNIGDAALGVITSQHYSAAHNSPENKSFVAAFKKANGGMRPNLMAMQAYDGMHMIYEALKKTKGATDGDAIVAAMKGMNWISPRGPDHHRSGRRAK